MHGGLTPDLENLSDINNVSRPMEVPDFGICCDLLWADPSGDIHRWGENKERGVSFIFG